MTGQITTAAYTDGNALIRKDGEALLFDGLGSERTVTNSSGAVQGTLTPSAFGQTTAGSGSSTSAYQFGATSGYRTEGDAGLTLVGCRFYDAQVGRFISRDTYLNQKPYAYCNGDPVNAADRTGHDPQKLPPIGSPEYRKEELEQAQEFEEDATHLAYLGGVAVAITAIPVIGEVASPITVPTIIVTGIYAGAMHLIATWEKYDATH